jgi:hypothetical protein
MKNELKENEWHLIRNNNGEWICDEFVVEMNKLTADIYRMKALCLGLDLDVQNGPESEFWCYKFQIEAINAADEEKKRQMRELKFIKSTNNTNPMNIKEFTERCRKLQGCFRVEMNEPMGVGPYRSSKKKQINMIVDGENTGKNFVNDFAFREAKRRVAKREKNETFDEYRLFNNLLSSQPMAFNLFCPFKEMMENGKEKEVSSIFQAIFPDKGIDKVENVELEYLHTDIENYLNDRTAMDVIIRYMDTEGKKSFIAIETKYTDVLGTNSASNTMLHKQWIKRLSEFKKESENELLNDKKPISQIYRNFLLTECYGVLEGANRYYSVILAPAQHPTTLSEVNSLKDELKPEYRYKITSVTLEDFIEKTLEFCPQNEKAPFIYFKNRYLDFSKIG